MSTKILFAQSEQIEMDSTEQRDTENAAKVSRGEKEGAAIRT